MRGLLPYRLFVFSICNLLEPCRILQFFIIVLALFIAQLGAAIFIYVKRGDVTKAVSDSIGKYGDKSAAGSGIQEGWDTLQKTV